MPGLEALLYFIDLTRSYAYDHRPHSCCDVKPDSSRMLFAVCTTLHSAALTLLDSGLYVSVQLLARSLLPLAVRNPAPHSALSLHYATNYVFFHKQKTQCLETTSYSALRTRFWISRVSGESIFFRPGPQCFGKTAEEHHRELC